MTAVEGGVKKGSQKRRQIKKKAPTQTKRLQPNENKVQNQQFSLRIPCVRKVLDLCLVWWLSCSCVCFPCVDKFGILWENS